jgi:hypothetical protein
MVLQITEQLKFLWRFEGVLSKMQEIVTSPGKKTFFGCRIGDLVLIPLFKEMIFAEDSDPVPTHPLPTISYTRLAQSMASWLLSDP